MYTKLFTSFLILLSLAACDSRTVMKERFQDENGDYHPIIVTDEHGNRYIITHEIGTNYDVDPLP